MATGKATTVATAQVVLTVDASKFKPQLEQALRQGSGSATIKPKFDKVVLPPSFEAWNKRTTAAIITLGRLFRTVHHGYALLFGAGLGHITASVHAFLKSGATDARMFESRLSGVRSAMARIGAMVLKTHITMPAIPMLGFAGGRQDAYGWVERLSESLRRLPFSQVQRLVDIVANLGKGMMAFAVMRWFARTIGEVGHLISRFEKLASLIKQFGLSKVVQTVATGGLGAAIAKQAASTAATGVAGVASMNIARVGTMVIGGVGASTGGAGVGTTAAGGAAGSMADRWMKGKVSSTATEIGLTAAGGAAGSAAASAVKRGALKIAAGSVAKANAAATASAAAAEGAAAGSVAGPIFWAAIGGAVVGTLGRSVGSGGTNRHGGSMSIGDKIDQLFGRYIEPNMYEGTDYLPSETKHLREKERAKYVKENAEVRWGEEFSVRRGMEKAQEAGTSGPTDAELSARIRALQPHVLESGRLIKVVEDEMAAMTSGKSGYDLDTITGSDSYKGLLERWKALAGHRNELYGEQNEAFGELASRAVEKKRAEEERAKREEELTESKAEHAQSYQDAVADKAREIRHLMEPTLHVGKASMGGLNDAMSMSMQSSMNKQRELRHINEGDSPQNTHIRRASDAMKKAGEALERFINEMKTSKKDDIKEAVESLHRDLLTPSASTI